MIIDGACDGTARAAVTRRGGGAAGAIMGESGGTAGVNLGGRTAGELFAAVGTGWLRSRFDGEAIAGVVGAGPPGGLFLETGAESSRFVEPRTFGGPLGFGRAAPDADDDAPGLRDDFKLANGSNGVPSTGAGVDAAFDAFASCSPVGRSCGASDGAARGGER